MYPEEPYDVALCLILTCIVAIVMLAVVVLGAHH